MPLTVSDGGGRGANGAGFGIILKLYIYILKKDIFLHLFLALCALKALNKLILFFSSTKLEDFFSSIFLNVLTSHLALWHVCLTFPYPVMKCHFC